MCLECGGSSRAVVPNLFGTSDRFHGRQFFQEPGWGGGGYGFRMIQARGFYCALHFSYYYISLTSDHQALDLGDWGPLLGEHNLTGNCHFKSISTCSGC